MRRILWAAGAALSLLPRLLLGAPDISVQMTVDVAVPAVGQPVHFNVTVANLGADAATDVQVTDQLPAELMIPAGMAPFPSAGTYDAATGVWSVGTLSPGVNATLVLPAVIAVTNQPACSVNSAVSSHPLDSNRANDRASAAVRRSAADRCVDLAAHVDGAYVGYCVTLNKISNYVRLANAGPDTASNVFIDLSQTPTVAPRLRLTVSNTVAGVTCSGTRCEIPSLAAGATIDLAAESDTFLNNTRLEFTLSVAASSTDTDYTTANNQSTATVVFPQFRLRATTSTSTKAGASAGPADASSQPQPTVLHSTPMSWPYGNSATITWSAARLAGRSSASTIVIHRQSRRPSPGTSRCG